MKRALLVSCLCSVLNAASDGPELSARNLVSAADHSSGHVAPGQIVILYPTNAGADQLQGAQLDVDGRVTTELGETRVLFDGIAAPIAYTVKGEVGAVVPYEVSGRKTTSVVVEYKGKRSGPVTVAVVESAPALFTLDSSGQGQAGMLNETGCCNSPRNPAQRGSIVAIYATGGGETNPPTLTGSVLPTSLQMKYPSQKLPVKVTLGGVPAEIFYAGAAPHAVAGLLQVNFRVPAAAPIGNAVEITLTVGDSSSPKGVTMAVRSAVQRILVVDPDAANGNWLTKVLTVAGYEVSIGRTAIEARSQAKHKPVDLVIASLTLPEDSRLQLVRVLREDRPQLAVIATAGKFDMEMVKQADRMGAQALLAAPMVESSLLGRVRDLLRSRPTPYVGVPHFGNDERWMLR